MRESEVKSVRQSDIEFKTQKEVERERMRVKRVRLGERSPFISA